jgi:hypothetical protein
MASNFKVGDHVEWNSEAGRVRGTIKKKIIERVKLGILHPEGEIRLTALSHFADSFSLDPTIMPLVIQAFGKYGRASSFGILRKAEDLVQSASTMDWLIDQLRGNYDLDDILDDNVHANSSGSDTSD